MREIMRHARKRTETEKRNTSGQPAGLGTGLGKNTGGPAAVGARADAVVQKTRGPIRDARGKFVRLGKRTGSESGTRTDASTEKRNADSGNPRTDEPAETGNAASAQENAEGFELVAAQEIAGSDRPKRHYSKRKSARTNAISDDAALAASVLIGVLDSAAQAMVSADAALTLNERNLIEEPLARIMDRLSPEVTEKIQTFSDPILLAFGLGLWGMRLYKINQIKTESATAQDVSAKAAFDAGPEPVEKQDPAPRDNGNIENKPLKPRNLIFETSPL